VGGRSGPAVPPIKAGRTQGAETKWRTPAQPELRHAAAGLRAATPTPPVRVPEALRHRARAMSADRGAAPTHVM